MAFRFLPALCRSLQLRSQRVGALGVWLASPDSQWSHSLRLGSQHIVVVKSNNHILNNS